MYQRVPTSAPLYHKQYDDEQPIGLNSSDTSDDESQSLRSSCSLERGLLQNQSHRITYIQNATASPSANSSFSNETTHPQDPMHQTSAIQHKQYTNTLGTSDRFLSTTSGSTPYPNDALNHHSQPLQRALFEATETAYSNLLSIVPSEHEVDLLSLATNQGTIGSECPREYTSSSDLSTKQPDHSIILPLTPRERRKSHTETQSVTCTIFQSGHEDKDKLSTWSYAYSYASNDIGEQKAINSQNAIQIKHPPLVHEIQPTSRYVDSSYNTDMYIEQVQISETNPDANRSLYTGCVTTNSVQVQQHTLLRKPRLMGPMLVYRSKLVPIQSIEINIDIAAETAFTEMNIIFVNNSETQINDALFALPTINGTVSSISVCMNHEDPLLHTTRHIASDLIDSNVYNHHNHGDSRHYDDIFNEWFDVYICDLFRFPISNIESHDSIKICSKWQQTLEWNQGRYHLNIPLQFADDVLPKNVESLYEIIQINVTLNSFFGPSISVGSNSHNLIVRETSDNGAQIRLHAESFGKLSSDFHIAYRYVNCNDITGRVLLQKKSNNEDDGHFILYINPMNDIAHHKYTETDCFARDIMFVLDRSISMNATTYHKITEAIGHALDNLLSTDTFGIVCFNETQIYFDGSSEANINAEKNPLFEARTEYIHAAKHFLANCEPEGGTDIVTPLKWTLHILNDIYEEKRARALSATVKSIPFVVLITDGSDYEEKEMIAHMELQSTCKNVRILTFGIGQHCNQYFLELLALKSRGWSSNAVYSEDIVPRMEALLSKCAYPMLKDVLIEPNDILDNKDITLYPTDAKDIYLSGKPIMICGEYRNNALPELLSQTNHIVNVSGVSVNGVPQVHELKVQNIDNNYFSIELQRMSAKQQLDELTSLFWFNDTDINQRDKIVNVATKQTVASEHTLMTCYGCSDSTSSIVIGVTNQLFGSPDIDHHLSKVVYSHPVAGGSNDTHHESSPSYCCGCCCVL